MEDINDALNKAKYMELVTVQHDDTEIILVPSVDRDKGGILWNQLDASLAPQRHLQTKRWMFPMLNDHDRNEMYEEAIKRACLRLDPNVPVSCLDIGSGTGLLAMLVNRYAPKGSNITSIEMASAMAQLAKLNVQHNVESKLLSTESRVKVVEGHSCSPSFELEDKAKICTSELLESGLLNEGILPAMRDAWERHLAADAIVVPCAAKVYAQLVEGTDTVAKYINLEGGLNDAPGTQQRTDNAAIRLATNAEGVDCDTRCSKTVALHADKLLTMDDVRTLSDPVEVLSFDFSAKDRLPPKEGRCNEIVFIPTSTGTVHGILFWWDLDLLDDIIYTTSPGKQRWQDHWHQNLFVLNDCNGDFAQVKQNEGLRISVSHDDSCIAFKILERGTSDNPKKSRISNEPSTSVCTFHSRCSAERMLQLSNTNRTIFFDQSIHAAIEAYPHGAASVLDLSDFSLCAILAGKHGARVSSVESSTGGVPLLSAYTAQVGNGLTDGSKFQIIQAYPEQITENELFGGSANIVVAEPYYEKLEGYHIIEALNYYYQLRALKARNLIQQNSRSIPSVAHIKACAIQSDNLRHAYSQLGGSCCGFRHDAIDSAQGDNEFDFNLPMWQYNYHQMTPKFRLATIHYDETKILLNDTWSRCQFEKPGRFDAVILWVDYGSATGSDTISTFDHFHRQQVQILKEPIVVTKDEAAATAASISDGPTNVMHVECKIDFNSCQDDYSLEIRVER